MPTPPQDPFELFRRLWGPLGVPLPGMAMPTLDPDEIEKRIAELRSVEAWLGMNLNMVKFSIQGLEVQKAALLAMRGGEPSRRSNERFPCRARRRRQTGASASSAAPTASAAPAPALALSTSRMRWSTFPGKFLIV